MCNKCNKVASIFFLYQRGIQQQSVHEKNLKKIEEIKGEYALHHLLKDNFISLKCNSAKYFQMQAGHSTGLKGV